MGSDEIIAFEGEPEGPGDCQVCGQPLTESLVRCPSCDTPHHTDCWEYNKGCATFACDKGPHGPPVPKATALTLRERAPLLFTDPSMPLIVKVVMLPVQVAIGVALVLTALAVLPIVAMVAMMTVAFICFTPPGMVIGVLLAVWWLRRRPSGGGPPDDRGTIRFE